MSMARPYISDETHHRMKQFAARKNISIQDAYDLLIQNVLDDEGKEKRGVILTK